MNTLDVELFAAGKWNNMTFSNDDLKSMVDNFKTLSPFHFAPVKLGHNGEQQITDGLPALGEIEKVWYSNKGKDGKPKLMGKLVGLPDVVFKAISKSRYQKLSIELDVGVEHKGKFMKYVLTAVALLGADIPAVNTLADLNAYMGRKSLFADSKTRVNFTQDFSYSINEDNDMDLAQAMTRIGELETEVSGLKDEARDSKSTIEKFEREDKTRESEAKVAKVTTARDAVNAVFEKAVKDEVITPAQRETFAKLLNVNDDDAVVKIQTADIDALLESTGKTMFTKSKTKEKGKDDRQVADAGSELTAKAYDLMNSNAGMGFTVAFDRVLKANPELAKEHLANESHVA